MAKWLVSINKDTTETTEDTNKNGIPKAEELAKIENMKDDDTAYIVNNLSYIVDLEYGHSQKQAPNGMVGITMQEVQQDFKEAVAESGFFS